MVKRFGRVLVLAKVDLSLEAHRVYTLFGRNGAGKTTLLQIAATLMKPTSGELFYEGQSAREAGDGIRSRIGLVSHASFLYSDLSLRENLEFYAALHGVGREVDLEAVLERADLRFRRDSPVRSLSRGMLQRLTIARALLHRPRLLLLDEPYTGLDPMSAERLTRWITELKSEATVLLTTHDLDRGMEVADEALIVERGRIAYQGEGGQDPAAFRRLFTDIQEGRAKA